MTMQEFADLLGIAEGSARRAAREGRFGSAVRRDRQGRWHVDDPDEARRQWLRRTALERVPPDLVERMAAKPAADTSTEHETLRGRWARDLFEAYRDLYRKVRRRQPLSSEDRACLVDVFRIALRADLYGCPTPKQET